MARSVLGGVRLLDDARHPAVPGAHHPPVPAWGPSRRAVSSVAAADALPVGRQQGSEGARPQQGRIPRQHHEVVKLTVVVAERGEGNRKGIAGPALYGLLDHLERDAREIWPRPGPLSSGWRRGLPRPPPGTAPGRTGRPAPTGPWAAAKPVQRFGPGAAHARPLAGSQHHGRHPWLLSGPFAAVAAALLGRSSSHSIFLVVLSSRTSLGRGDRCSRTPPRVRGIAWA